MSSKHTPGPWIWGAEARDSRVMATEAPDSWRDRTIAEVHHGEDVMGEANAHLIAAAPDLLEACEAVADDVCHAVCPSTWRTKAEQTHNGICVQARAAIKKARGET